MPLVRLISQKQLMLLGLRNFSSQTRQPESTLNLLLKFGLDQVMEQLIPDGDEDISSLEGPFLEITDSNYMLYLKLK